MSSMRAGVRVTFALAAAASAYLLATPHGPHRLLLALMPMLAALDGAAISVARRADRPHGAPLRALRFGLEPGALRHRRRGVPARRRRSDSPFAAIFFISVAFAALSLPPRPVALIATADVAGMALVAAIDGRWPAGLIFVLPALAAIAALGMSIATRARSASPSSAGQGGHAAPPRAADRVPRQRDRRAHRADERYCARRSRAARLGRGRCAVASSSPRRCTTSARSPSPTRSCSSRAR